MTRRGEDGSVVTTGRIAIVLSQPMGYSLGTDARVRALTKGFTQLGAEVHLFDPYGLTSPGSENTAHVHSGGTTRGSVALTGYRWIRRVSNHPALAPIFLGRKMLVNAAVRMIANFVGQALDPREFDLVIAEQEFAALALGRLLGDDPADFFADFHGVWAEEAVVAGLIRRDSPRYRYLRRLEDIAFSRPQRIIAVSEEMRHFLQTEYKVSSERVIVAPLGASPRITELPLREGPPRLVWAGTITPRENINLFLDALPAVLSEFPQAEIYITNRGDALSATKRRATQLGLHPKFFYYRDPRDFFSFLASCHVGILTSTSDICRQMSYPAKLFDYLSVGLPVVANDACPWGRIIREWRPGILTASTPESFAEGIISVLRDPDAQREMGMNGINTVKGPLNYLNAASSILRHTNLGQRFRGS